MKKTLVISLGGSVINPRKINRKFLKQFKKTIQKNLKNYKFIVVCGGGYPARKEINKLKSQKKSIKLQCMAGIKAIKENTKIVKKLFNKTKDVTFKTPGKYSPNETSDSISAKIARANKSEFINITNVSGLFTSDPLENKKARLIPKISWKNFEKKAQRIKYHPGQHFVLDQHAATIIRRHKIKTYLIGPNMRNFNKLLKCKKFKGTIING